jgi:hypothetical protein
MRKLLVSDRVTASSRRIGRLRRHLSFLALALILGMAIAGSGPALSALLPSGGAVVTATTSGSTLTLSRPTTVASGDVLIASIDMRVSSGASITPPAGWSLIRRDSNAPGYRSLTQALYYRVAGSSEPASYRWSFGLQAPVAGAILDLKGIDRTSPVDSHSGAFTPQSGSIVAPSVTTTAAGDVVLAFFGTTSSTTITPPGGLTEEFDVGWASGDRLLDAEGAGYVKATAGVTGDLRATTSGVPSSAVGQLLALRASAASPPSPASITLPARAAFYYPWFPETWHATDHYHPVLGQYGSAALSTIDAHLAALRYGKIDVAIASWSGQGSRTDGRIPTILNETNVQSSPVKWALYYQPESQGNPTVAQIQADLAYINQQYGGDPAFARVNSKPVIFVSAHSDGCEMASRWTQANANHADYISLKVFSGYRTCADQPDAWHQYSPAVREDNQSGRSISISPGYWNYSEADPRLTRDLSTFNTAVQHLVASSAPWKLVTSFNQWGQSSSVEGATEWQSSSGFGTFLDALHNDGTGAPPPTALSATTPPRNTRPTECVSESRPSVACATKCSRMEEGRCNPTGFGNRQAVVC